MKLIMKSRLLPLLILILTSHTASALDTDRADVRLFIESMVSEHDYDRATLEAVLQNAETQESILKAISKPAEKTLQWHEYRDIFLTDERIKAGAAFWREHDAELQRISSAESSR